MYSNDLKHGYSKATLNYKMASHCFRAPRRIQSKVIVLFSTVRTCRDFFLGFRVKGKRLKLLSCCNIEMASYCFRAPHPITTHIATVTATYAKD
jgi:hypothetical protein